jgi:hypothetical protein
MSCLATNPNNPNEESSSGKGQRKEIYYMAYCWKRQSKCSNPFSGTNMSFRFKYRKNWGIRREVCIIKFPFQGPVKGVGQLLIISGLVRWDLVWIVVIVVSG